MKEYVSSNVLSVCSCNVDFPPLLHQNSRKPKGRNYPELVLKRVGLNHENHLIE